MSITWNGVSSDAIGVIVERIPNRYVPTRRFSPQQVAGRNGNILLVDKSFPNVEQEYEVYLSAEAQGLPSVARACAEWLMGPDGYCRLEDSYDTTVYREAFLMGGYDLENILNKFGRCTITFSCKPQKYLLTGDTPIEIPAGITTYTGDVVQFDGVTGASITSLSTTITPIQDLHGYDSPWPGGGGRNKFDPNEAQNNKWINSTTGLIENTNGYWVTGYIPVTAGDVVRCQTKGSTRNAWYNTDKSQATYVAYSGGGNGITAPADGFIVLTVGGSAIPFGSGFIVTLNDADLTFAPYSNICPITGRTGLSVYVSPTQDPDDATVYNVHWTSEAGTVYGGTVDVVTGGLTDKMGNITVDDFTNFVNGSSSGGLHWVEATVSVNANAEAISSMLEWKATRTAWGSATECFATENGRIRVYTSETSLADFKTKHADLQVVYELATPITYQLTPQEIGVLVGENNVWTSSGPVSVTVEAPFVGTVTNPTPFEARPMLEVSGVGEITINGKTIQILEAVSDFNIDCESMEAEDNSKIYCIDFPELSGGENKIVGDGSITALTVTPRWWTL